MRRKCAGIEDDLHEFGAVMAPQMERAFELEKSKSVKLSKKSTGPVITAGVG